MKPKTNMIKPISLLSGLIHNANGFLVSLGMKLVFGVTFLTFSLVCSSNVQAQSSQTWCAIEYIDTEHQSMNSVAIGLGYVNYSQEICEDSAIQLNLFADKDMKVVNVSGSSTTSPETYYENNTWSRQLNEEEKDVYWCLLISSSSGNFSVLSAGDFLIHFLPSTPEAFRIPNQIEVLFQEQTLAASLMIELYSAGWQFLLIMAFIKFYRLIPFKAT